MIKRILILIVMIFPFFGLFGQTNKFKTVDAVAMLEKCKIGRTYESIHIHRERIF